MVDNTIKGIKVFSGNEEIVAKYDYNSLENKPSESKDLFNLYPNTKLDFFLKQGTFNDGTVSMFLQYSTTKNAKNVIINMEPNQTYDIHITNPNSQSTYRMRAATYKEEFSTLKLLGPSASPENVAPNMATGSAEILCNIESSTAEAKEFKLKYTNNKKLRTMIIFCGWGQTISINGYVIPVTNNKPTIFLNDEIKISEKNLADGAKIAPSLWEGYLDTSLYTKQDMNNFENTLVANMSTVNENTQKILEVAYNFWKHRGEFIYSGYTARDKPWDYWTKVGEVDSLNTGFTVTEGNGGYKRIDCSTFVRYVTNGFDYYSTPYYNALETTDVVQGGLNNNGEEEPNSDITICRSGKFYVRPNKKYILEAVSPDYKFTKLLAYDRTNKFIKSIPTVTTGTIFTPTNDICYLRAEMKVKSTDNYKPAVKGVSPAGIVRCLRIRENERLTMNAECPESAIYANAMAQWFDNNGYEIEYNPYFWEDTDFKPGTIIFMGHSNSSPYKHITHIALYIGSGYIMHSIAPYKLIGGEGIMVHKLKDMEIRYSYPLADVVSPKYSRN